MMQSAVRTLTIIAIKKYINPSRSKSFESHICDCLKKAFVHNWMTDSPRMIRSTNTATKKEVEEAILRLIGAQKPWTFAGRCKKATPTLVANMAKSKVMRATVIIRLLFHTKMTRITKIAEAEVCTTAYISGGIYTHAEQSMFGVNSNKSCMIKASPMMTRYLQVAKKMVVGENLLWYILISPGIELKNSHVTIAHKHTTKYRKEL